MEDFFIREKIEKLFEVSGIPHEKTGEREWKGESDGSKFKVIVKDGSYSLNKLTKLLKKSKSCVIFTRFSDNFCYYRNVLNKCLAVNINCLDDITSKEDKSLQYELLMAFKSEEKIIGDIKKSRQYKKAKKELVEFIESLSDEMEDISHDYKIFRRDIFLGLDPLDKRKTAAALFFSVTALLAYAEFWPKARIASTIALSVNLLAGFFILAKDFKAHKCSDRLHFEGKSESIIINRINSKIMEVMLNEGLLESYMDKESAEKLKRRYGELIEEGEKNIAKPNTNSHLNYSFAINIFFTEAPFLLGDSIKLWQMNNTYNVLNSETFFEFFSRYYKKEYGEPKLAGFKLELPINKPSLLNPYFIFLNIVPSALLVLSWGFLMLVLASTF